MKPIVQISLDIINLDEALETATMAMRAGVDWLEAGKNNFIPYILVDISTIVQNWFGDIAEKPF